MYYSTVEVVRDEIGVVRAYVHTKKRDALYGDT